MIVGIDPGVTTAIAILDIDGNVLDVHSRRDIKSSEVIQHIFKFGNPIIISSDVYIAPRSVEKIATKLGCILYSLETSLKFSKKKKLVKEHSGLIKNHHEVDALSACVKAWKHYRALFLKVDAMLKKFNRQEIFSDIISKLIKQGKPNIKEAIRETLEKEFTKVELGLSNG